MVDIRYSTQKSQFELMEKCFQSSVGVIWVFWTAVFFFKKIRQWSFFTSYRTLLLTRKQWEICHGTQQVSGSTHYNDYLKICWWFTLYRWRNNDSKMFISFRRNFGAMARFDLNFQSFCVLCNILAPNFVHVCSDISMKDADNVYGRKYWSQRSFEGCKKGIAVKKKTCKVS